MIRFGLLVILSVILYSCSKTQGRPGAVLPTIPTPTITDFTPDTGVVGTEVTITGFNFSPDLSANVVRFNGVIAEVKTASPNTLTVIVPADAISGRIAVTVKQRTFTSAKTFTVLKGTWLQKADFGGSARGNAVGFSIEGKAYILTGYSSAWENDLWEYDTLSDAWTKKADFPGDARERAVAFAIGKKGYIPKRIEFTITEIQDIANLAFGDIDENNEIDDYSITDNGDRNKVLATVAYAAEIYLNKYPERWIYFKGSTQERTRLYRMAIGLNLDELTLKFDIYAEQANGIIPFRKNIEVKGLLIRKKNV